MGSSPTEYMNTIWVYLNGVTLVFKKAAVRIIECVVLLVLLVVTETVARRLPVQKVRRLESKSSKIIDIYN